MPNLTHTPPAVFLDAAKAHDKLILHAAALGWVVSSVGRQGVWVRGDRAAGAGDEERVLGTMRRSRGDSVSEGVGVVGVAVAADGDVGDG